MALAGHDTPALIINSSATNSSYSGTVTGVTAGHLYVVTLEVCSDSSLNTPSSWTVTLGGDTMAYQAGQSSSGVFGFTAIFTVVATGSGDLTLSITTNNNCRALAAHAFDITGFDATTPIANSGQADSHTSNTTSLTSPNGVTTAADGNAIIGCVAVKGGDVTNLAVGAADGSTTGQTGGNSSSDAEWGVAWDRTPTAASVTFAWTWTTADRPGAAWVEVAEDAGGAGTDSLTANDVESASEVSAPNVGQEHALTATSVESTSEVSAPVLSQIVALTADDVESTSEVTAPAVGQAHALTADDVESASEVTAPAVGQAHALTADDVEANSEVTAPAVGQVHALSADDVESASEVTAPALTEVPFGADVLNAEDIESASEVSAPVLAQVHVLTATSVQATSEVSTTVLNRDTDEQQPGGFIPRPVVYVDKDGNPVDIEAVAQKAVRAAPKKQRQKVRAAAERVVDAVQADDTTAMLADRFAADLRRLVAHLERAERAALELAIEEQVAAQLNDDAAFLLLMAA